MAKTKIEWATDSWNPIRARNRKTGKVGWHCEHATTGCINCYAEGFNKRLGTGFDFKPGHLANGDIEIFLDEEMLTQPLRWKKPRMIFVGSMNDLFAEFVPDDWIDKLFAVMALCPQHNFQVLTKRAERMKDCIGDDDRSAAVADIAHQMWAEHRAPEGSGHISFTYRRDEEDCKDVDIDCLWPLPNVWLGVSAERQEEADARIPLLLQTQAAVRFISAEPLLGPIDISDYLVETARSNWDSYLNWVIAGGESGPKARLTHPLWVRALRDQCVASPDVAFFFKQWGNWAPYARGRIDDAALTAPGSSDEPLQKFGKKAAGRKLDGREHNAMPACPPEPRRREIRA